MEEIAFAMQLKPGVAAEYQRRHDDIQPELTDALHEAGIRDYSIFLDAASGRLFGVQKRLPGHTADALPGLPLLQRWWAHMADLMDTNPDNSPVVTTLVRVFHQEQLGHFARWQVSAGRQRVALAAPLKLLPARWLARPSICSDEALSHPRPSILLLAISAFARPAAPPAQADPAWVKQVSTKTMPKAKATFAAAKYGAVGDDKTLNTLALQKAIDAAAKKGGVVTLASGQYLTSLLFLKKGVELHHGPG